MGEQAAVRDGAIVEVHLVKAERRTEPQRLGVVLTWSFKHQIPHFRRVACGAQWQRAEFIDVRRDAHRFGGVKEAPKSAGFVAGRGGVNNQHPPVGPHVEGECRSCCGPMIQSRNGGVGGGKCFDDAGSDIVACRQLTSAIHLNDHACTCVPQSQQLSVTVGAMKHGHGGDFRPQRPGPIGRFSQLSIGLKG